MIREKMLTFGQLNYEIDNFLYGCNDKRSKPQLILESKLKNGWQLSEKWTLFHLLPLLVDSLIMPNKYWDCYLQLCEVVDIIMAPVARRSWMQYLEEKTTQFLVTSDTLFKGMSIPKMHYTVHYPQLIKLYGPLLQYWSKHLQDAVICGMQLRKHQQDTGNKTPNETLLGADHYSKFGGKSTPHWKL